MAITVKALTTAVRNTLATATVIADDQGVAHDVTQMKEGMPDRHTLQVYPTEGQTNVTGNTDRASFGAEVRHTETIIHADYYARQRSHLGEDLTAMVDGIDALIAVLETQKRAPLFGESDIKSFRWRWEYVTFVYGDPEVKYAGVRFFITLTLF